MKQKEMKWYILILGIILINIGIGQLIYRESQQREIKKEITMSQQSQKEGLNIQEGSSSDEARNDHPLWLYLCLGGTVSILIYLKMQTEEKINRS